ncbi:replicative DNA helicase [Caviibacter abscessus]|uniref:replicative DNA helicase n=1 Tax=Caviibacter abscessus TaxID=1766719 RepID=UPI00082C9CEA|nr:replicative DNA helicase [Caviibacter abscessus]
MQDNFENIGAEEYLLGMLLCEGSLMGEISRFLKPDDFNNKNNSSIYSAMYSIYSRNGDINLIVLEEELKKLQVYENIGGRERLNELFEMAPLETSIDIFAGIVKDKSVKRKVIEICHYLTDLIKRDYGSYNDILDIAQSKIIKLTSDNNTSDVLTLEDLGKQRIEKIIKLSEHDANEHIGIPSGYNEYDRITGGFHKSDLLILAARPGVGKTAFALNLALNASKNHKKVLIFSLEMGNEQLYDRLLAIESGFSLSKIRNNALSENETIMLNKHIERMSKYDLYITDVPGVNLLDIKNICRKLKTTDGIDFVIVDYLQLITPTADASKVREQQVSEISRGLKILAKELQVPILTLSQLSRSVENRTDKTPMLSDLRESGAIEQDADIVMFLSKEPRVEGAEETMTNVIIGKHRNGSIGELQLAFRQECQKFINIHKVQSGGEH